jgi:hypothetical protein
MPFLVLRSDGRFEIRESIATSDGPRARSLASGRGALVPELVERAARRATRPFDADALREKARGLGIPVSERREDRAARELLQILRGGGALDPALCAQLREELEQRSHEPAPLALAEVAEWVGADDARRGEALRGLLRVSDRITRGRGAVRTRPRRRFPRFRSRRARG